MAILIDPLIRQQLESQDIIIRWKLLNPVLERSTSSFEYRNGKNERSAFSIIQR
jgi:hypothetical protein